MENQRENLLDRVYSVLRKRWEQMEWITGKNGPTGIAFIPVGTDTPVSLLYTMIDNPETLIIDVLFATKVKDNHRVEISIILSELNSHEYVGAFQLDSASGYVYYRQSFVLDNMKLDDSQFIQLMKNIEAVAVEKADAYSNVIETEFPR